ncbi:MAG: helix-turn-helix domain-containing protein [Actinomycetota bacterium]|nr:helix-turn-helix domain-containing protein [Actinomycetota bacterium]
MARAQSTDAARGTVWSARHPVGPAEILPDGCMDLIWTGRRLLVAGPDTRPHHRVCDAVEHMVGIRLAPGVAPCVLGVPAQELRDLRVDLTDLWSPADAAPWIEELAAAGQPAAVLNRLSDTRRWELPGWVAPVAVALADGSRVDDAVDLLGSTTRTFHRRSLRHFGYGPKTLQRILRVRAARADLAAGAEPAAVAADRRFADQSHMHREFVDLVGRAPGTFARTPGSATDQSSAQ